MNHIFRKFRSKFSFLRHPFRITCLKCGFLSLGDHELDSASRILLDCRGAAGCPPMDKILCSRSLWIYFDLTYSTPPTDEIFDLISAKQRFCKGYFKYHPGFSPKEHKDLLLRRKDRKEKIIIAIFSGLIGVLLGFFSKWLSVIFKI